MWIIEDDKRKCEKDSNFGEEFIRLSRDIHFLNDTRAKIKLDINTTQDQKLKKLKNILVIDIYIFFPNTLLSCELKK